MICSKKNFGPRKSLGLNKIFDPKEIFSKKKHLVNTAYMSQLDL